MSRFIDFVRWSRPSSAGSCSQRAAQTALTWRLDAIEGLTEDYLHSNASQGGSAVLQTPQRVRGEDRPADVDQRP